MKKRLIAALIFAFTMIYLSISVSAAGTFGSQAYVFMATNTTNTASNPWQTLTIESDSFETLSNTSGSVQNRYMYLGFKVNQVPQDGYILVITITVDSIVSQESIELLGVGQADSNTLPTSNTTAAKLAALPLTQEIIASTVAANGTNQTRISVTFKAKGFANQYPIAAWKFTKNGSMNSIACCNVQLYETIEEAAGSGVTPEEMREVLSSWGEEELLPGIKDSVQSGVASGMEEALRNEKQEASSEGGDLIDQIHGGLSGTFDDIEQATQSFTSLADALKYNGQTATLSIPAITLPFIGTISEGINWDMTGYIQQAFPSGFLLLIRCIFSLGVVMYPILEITMQVQRLLDKGGK